MRPWGQKNTPMGVFFYPHGRTAVKYLEWTLVPSSLMLKDYFFFPKRKPILSPAVSVNGVEPSAPKKP